MNLDPTGMTPEALAALVNDALGGYDKAMGLHFTSAKEDEVLAELQVAPVHQQPFGLVHGGVYAGVVETLASVGAGIQAAKRGASVVGLENHTSFLRATRDGKLSARAKPLATGARSQVWECTISDSTGRTVATGRVRLMALEGGTRIAGEAVSVLKKG